MKQQRIALWIVFSALLGALIGAVALQVEAQGQATTVTPGTQVAIEYTLKLEKALEGMKVGESKQVTVPPEEGYGTVDKEAFVEVAKDQIPPDAQTVGAQLQGQNASGQQVRARVAEVKDNTVVVDFNHPLAGKTLYFDVRVLNIQQATGQ
jgi:FKBP-type peptidyl-prolyl cis-trans isomerase 2